MNLVRRAVHLLQRFFLCMVEDLKELWYVPKPLLPEDNIPRHQGKPDLSYDREPVEHIVSDCWKY
jgi:hypothetical protein